MMWSGITSYLLNYENKECEDFAYSTREGEDEWLFVDLTDSKQEEEYSKEESREMLPDIILHTNDSKQESGRSATPTYMDESWYITPPPCFTADAPLLLETSPLENLLIEHPSMSVYGSKPSSTIESITAKKIKPKKKIEVTDNDDKKHGTCKAICSLVQKPNQEISQPRNCKVPYRLSTAMKRTEYCLTRAYYAAEVALDELDWFDNSI